MNESTFEANLNRVLYQYFPFIADFKIVHQEYFNIILGHKEIPIKNHIQKGFGDVLVYLNETPYFLFELKKSSEPIDENVKTQALSYARLTKNITPITIITNSVITKIYNSVTGEEINDKTDSFIEFDKYIKNTVKIAGDTLKKAIDKIIFGDYEVIKKYVSDNTTEKLNRLIGKKNEIHKPIYPDCIINRKCVDMIINTPNKNFMLFGRPFCGKTNVLYQVFQKKSDDVIAFYFDLNNHENIFESISIQMSESLGIEINETKAKKWIKNITDNTSKVCYFLLDNYSLETANPILNFLSIVLNGKSKIILTVDESIKDLILSSRGRNNQNILNSFNQIDINEIENEDFLKYIIDRNMIIDHGFRYYSEFKNPFFIKWSLLPIILLENRNENIIEIPSIPIANNIFEITNLIYKQISEEFRFLHHKLAEIYFEQQKNNDFDPYLLIYSIGNIFISEENILSKLNENEIEKLINNGFLKQKLIKNKYRLYFPQIPFLILFLLKSIIVDEILKIEKSGYDEAGALFYSFVHGLPYFDSFSSIILLEILTKNTELGFYIIKWLSQKRPSTSVSRKGFKGVIALHNTEPTDISISDMEDGSLTKDIEPWVILSQFLCQPFEFNGEMDFYISLLELVGSYNRILMRIDSFTSKEPIITHDFNNKIILLCSRTGLVEPITRALSMSIIMIPEKIKESYDRALLNNNLPYLYRLNTAANHIGDFQKIEVKNVAQYIIEKHKIFFSKKLNNFLAGKRLRPNDKCWCGSNKKYKNCCMKKTIC